MIPARMRRQRHQDGWVELRGKREKHWYGHYYRYLLTIEGEHRQHQGIDLGLKSQVTKKQAEVKLREHILKTLGTSAARRDDRQSLEWFIRHRYIPLRQGNWRESTDDTNQQLINDHIIKPLGSRRLAELDKVELQVHLNNLAKDFSQSLVLHVRIFLKSIFDEAVDQGFLDHDPARKLTVPITRKVEKPILEWPQLQLVLSHLTEWKELLITIGMVTALRPSELFALKWKSFAGEYFDIRESIYRGKLRPYAKTKKSEGRVAIPAKLAKRVEAWRKSRDASPEAFIFPNADGGFMSVYNFQNRTLTPIRKVLGLDKLNFQILRRSFATLAQKHGSLKDIQGQMRHAKPDVTAEEYMQVIPESVMEMAESMYAALTKGTGKIH